VTEVPPNSFAFTGRGERGSWPVALAEGLRRSGRPHIGVKGITGSAGPGGGSEEKNHWHFANCAGEKKGTKSGMVKINTGDRENDFASTHGNLRWTVRVRYSSTATQPRVV